MHKKYIIKANDFQRTLHLKQAYSMEPSVESIDKILQFSACYRAQSISENHFIAVTLN